MLGWGCPPPPAATSDKVTGPGVTALLRGDLPGGGPHSGSQHTLSVFSDSNPRGEEGSVVWCYLDDLTVLSGLLPLSLKSRGPPPIALHSQHFGRHQALFWPPMSPPQ